MIRRIPAIAATCWLAACNPFDDNQVPVIAVGPGLRPVISFTPSPAYELRVYPGDQDGDRSDFIARQGLVLPAWYASGSSHYENALHSKVTYGVPPPGSEVAAAPPLTAGANYTVTVLRKDEQGGGEGFSNTRHRYVGTHTFVASE
ncbi:MAG: hypothetical protein WD929_03795 [Steroidobacteraceae bacterium]